MQLPPGERVAAICPYLELLDESPPGQHISQRVAGKYVTGVGAYSQLIEALVPGKQDDQPHSGVGVAGERTEFVHAVAVEKEIHQCSDGRLGTGVRMRT